VNIYLHELRTYRKNTLIWISALSLGSVLLFWMFPTFADNMAAFEQLLSNYPDVILKAFGLSISAVGTVPGFLSFVVTFFSLCGAVQAMAVGISLLSRETTGKTVDFLLTRPVARGRVLTAKLLAGFTCVAATSACYVGVSLAAGLAVTETPFSAPLFLLIALTFFYLQTLFLALGFCIGAVAMRVRSVLPVALSTVFGLFAVGMVAASLNLSELYYLSPFKYFDTVDILITSGYRVPYAVTAAAVTVLSVAAAYAVYLRRDIHAA
jgi:ABC-2 type transport system permease protein